MASVTDPSVIAGRLMSETGKRTKALERIAPKSTATTMHRANSAAYGRC